MNKPLYIFLLFLLSASSCKQREATTRNTSFYDTSNYYILDKTKSAEFYLDSSSLNRLSFILRDEADFLIADNYDYYFIFIKELHFEVADIIYAMKIPARTDNVIVDYSIITYNNRKHFYSAKEKLGSELRMDKKVSFLQNDTAKMIKNKIEYLIKNIHPYKHENPVYLRENNIIMLCYNKGKYYVITQEFSSEKAVWDFNYFLLDTLLRTPYYR